VRVQVREKKISIDLVLDDTLTGISGHSIFLDDFKDKSIFPDQFTFTAFSPVPVNTCGTI